MNPILDYERHRGLALTRFVLSDLITEVLNRLSEPLQARHLTVKTFFSTAADLLEGDRNQIAQVLLTVIDNAIEVSPLNGAIIDIRTHEALHHEQSGMMIRVNDARTAIPLGLLSRVFDQTFPSDKLYGTGLGMTLCQNIIERHRGNIHVTSTVDMGTIVSIWLPVNQKPQQTTGYQRPADIVVADDEDVFREAIVKRLMRQGHHAVGYDCGAALLAGLHHSLPDLVLLDLNLPGPGGLETLKQVCQLAPAALVIVLAAYGTMQDAEETIKLGAYDFMIKSVDTQGLDVVIARALEVLWLRQRLADRTCDLAVWGLAKT